MSSPSGVRGKAVEALALFMFLEGKMQHLINIPAPNLLKLTSNKRDIRGVASFARSGGGGAKLKSGGQSRKPALNLTQTCIIPEFDPNFRRNPKAFSGRNHKFKRFFQPKTDDLKKKVFAKI